MENRFINSYDANLSGNTPQKGHITLPAIALALSCYPFLIVLSPSFVGDGIIFSPIVGIVVGIISLCQGKEIIGTRGVAISIIAVALPFVSIFLLFVGASAGVIRFM